MRARNSHTNLLMWGETMEFTPANERDNAGDDGYQDKAAATKVACEPLFKVNVSGILNDCGID